MYGWPQTHSGAHALSLPPHGRFADGLFETVEAHGMVEGGPILQSHPLTKDADPLQCLQVPKVRWDWPSQLVALHLKAHQPLDGPHGLRDGTCRI